MIVPPLLARFWSRFCLFDRSPALLRGARPAKLLQAFEPVDVHLAVEMVDLMLERLPEQAIAAQADLFAAGVPRLNGDPPTPLYLCPVAGHGQAAFVRLPLVLALDDLRIDQDVDLLRFGLD